MFPDHRLSSRPVASSFLTPKRDNLLLDFEWGGKLRDTSEGLQSRLWQCLYEDNQIVIDDGKTRHVLLDDIADVEQLSLAFDLAMRPMVAYVADGRCYLWWYDTAQAQQVTTDFGAGLSFPNLSLDDSRPVQSAVADVIFAYIKDDHVCMRLQRERFQTERVLFPAKQLWQIGMMVNNRFGFAYYHWS